MTPLPTLDAHAHLDARLHPGELGECGMVLAQTISLDEAARSIGHLEPNVAWGAGCHPRLGAAQAAFEPGRYRLLLERTAIAGEVGLDGGLRVPWETQLATFRQILRIVAERPRIVSIHSVRATGRVLDELRRTPVVAPILHWWTGTPDEASRAVQLGCYFSIHAAVARRSLFRARVPLERVLLETDHGDRDPPAAVPLRIGWVEHLVGQQYGVGVRELRATVWANFAAVVRATGTRHLLPPGMAGALPS
jgi:TatD DNase family protein